jgi:hypothetical protein
MQIVIVMLLSLMLTGCASQYAATTCAVGEMNGAAKANCGCACAVVR